MNRGQVRQVTGLVLLASIGVAGLILPVANSLQNGVWNPVAVLGLLSSLLLAVPVWYIAYWTHHRAANSSDTLLIAGWCLGFTVVAALITAAAVLTQAGRGVYLVEPLLLVNNVGMAGSVLGVIVGYFHASSRQRARKYATARDELADQKQQLVFLNRLLRHDIRNDVNVIHGYAELLTEEYPDEPRLETILRKSEDIDELTVLARDVSETATETPTEDIRLAASVSNAIEQVRDSFPDATIRVAGDLPPELTVRANGMLSAVFQNLFRNAIQHNDNSTPEVTVQVDPSPETVQVSIADNGPGIPDGIEQNLFKPGQKATSSTGSGLGLYLVDTLLTSYDGDIRVSDDQSNGTTVTVALPRSL